MNSHTNESPRIFWPDLIRSVSIVLVILIHASSPLLNQWGDIRDSEWMVGNIYDSLARISVPLFFMVSGYLVLGRQESIVDFYRKRLQKVVVPLLVWSVIYLVWEEGFANYTVLNAIKAISYSVLTRPASYHLWFLYELLLNYLFVPLIRVFTHSAESIHLWYLAAIWFLFGPVLDIVQESLGVEFAIDLGFFTSYIGYFLLGHILGQRKPSRALTLSSLCVFAAFWLFTIYATYSGTVARNEFYPFYYQYLRINIVFMSASAFILLKTLGGKVGDVDGNRLKWAGRIAAASFGIYLIHVLILTIIRRGDFGFQISVLSGQAILLVPLLTILVFLISWLIVALLQRIPILRVIVPG